MHSQEDSIRLNSVLDYEKHAVFFSSIQSHVSILYPYPLLHLHTASGGRFRSRMGRSLFQTTGLYQSVLKPGIVTNKVRVFVLSLMSVGDVTLLHNFDSCVHLLSAVLSPFPLIAL